MNTDPMQNSEAGYLVEKYYDVNVPSEWSREERHRTEFAITRRVLKKYLPEPPARLLDCGGGPGRYSLELVRQGYSVTLFDLSTANLEWARQKAGEAGLTLEGYFQGTATDLSRFPDEQFDGILLMGPLYHLLEEAERIQALRQAWRVLKPGGKLFAAFLNRYAALRDLALKHPGDILAHSDECQRILEEGFVPPGPASLGQFVAYFTQSNGVAPLVKSAGFQVQAVFGVEGLIAALENQVNPLSGAAWEAWEQFNWQAAQDEAMHGSANHLLVVAVKPAWRKVLAEICEKMNGAGMRYKVVGGTALVLRGLLEQSKDIDLEMDVEGAYHFQKMYADQIELPVLLCESEVYRSHFGRFRIGEVQVEVMGDIQRKEGEAWVPTQLVTETTIDLDGVPIHTAWIEEEFLALVRRGKLERAAACLPSCDPKKLVDLMRGTVSVKVI